MPFLYSGRILIVDLGSKKTEERPLDETLIEENLGGALVAQRLYEEFESQEPLVLSTGLFTATLFPAGALGIITAKSPITGKLAHAPFVLMGGMEIKLTGFDFIVIKGKSASPTYLWLHDELADLQDASELWGKNSWETTESIRNDLGEDLIQVLTIGAAGEKGRNSAQVILNFWGTGDKFGFGKVFGSKNLKAIASRGLGLIEISSPEEFVQKAVELKSKIKNGVIFGKNGVLDFCQSIGVEPAKDWITPAVHRYTSCFSCPYTCNTFLKYNESPTVLDMGGVAEPGFLMTDTSSALAFKKIGLSGADTGRVLELCAKLGIEPATAAFEANKAGVKDLSGVKKILDSMVNNEVENVSPFIKNWGEDGKNFESPFSPWAPLRPLFTDFGLGQDPEKNSVWWKKRNAIFYILGICPIFSLMTPEIEENNLLEFIRLGTGIDKEKGFLDKIVGKLKF